MITTNISTFYLGNQLFGIPTLFVQEIKTDLSFTNVPLTPDYVVGILNLRGQILLAVDLSKRLHLSNHNSTNEVSIIAKSDVGLICLNADSVGNVIEVYEKDFEPAYDALEKKHKGMIKGVYTHRKSRCEISV